MLSEETIQSIAPSSKNFSDGKALQKDLLEMGKKEHVFWGKCKGSGKDPYIVMFNENTLGYKCSCPVGNRGIVCKHVLGLMIKSVHQAEIFTESEPPTWAENWVKKQLEKKEKVETKSEKVEETVKIGLARIREGKSKTTKNREKQMNEGIELLDSYLNDVLNEGTLIASTWTDERKNVLIESLNAAKMPALAYMIEENLDNNPAETLTKAAILSNLWKKRENLTIQLQEFLLGALGSYIKKEEVIQLNDILKDTWLCVGYYNEYRYKPTRMTLHHWFLIGKHTGQWTRIMHTEVYAAYGGAEPKPNIQIGRIYEGSIAYFPASQRGVLLHNWQVSQTQDKFTLQKNIEPHYQDKTITELPLFFTIKSHQEAYIQKIQENIYRVNVQNQVYECKYDLSNLWLSQGQNGFTLIYAQKYPHAITVLGGILENGVFIPVNVDIEHALDRQPEIPDVLKKRLEVGKKMGNIQLEGLDNQGLQPLQQWARTFLWYNYGIEKNYPFEKPEFITDTAAHPVPETFFKLWNEAIKIDKVFIEKGLSILKEKKYTLMPYMLAVLKKDIEDISYVTYKEVLGERARYIFNLQEEQHDEEYYVKLFEEGKTDERKKAHRYLLKHNPRVLKDLIKQTYKKDKPELRKYWLRSDEVILFDGDDEEWIKTQLKTEKNEDVRAEWIWKLGDMLGCTAHKPFSIAQDWVKAIEKYIIFENGGKKIKADITLPEKGHFEYFTEMATWRGIHGAKAGVLMFLLSCKPLYTWQYSIEELATALKGNEYEQVFWDGLVLSCYRYTQETPQHYADELYKKGKYSSYWRHLLYPTLSTEVCIEEGFGKKELQPVFIDQLLKKTDITHAHLIDILEKLKKIPYKIIRPAQFIPDYTQLFVKHAKTENLQTYIDMLHECTQNTLIAEPLQEALKKLQKMYSLAM